MATTATSLNMSSILSPAAQCTPERGCPANQSLYLPNPSSTIVPFTPSIKAPFEAIRCLFDYSGAYIDIASSLNATYPKRGIYKTAATYNDTSDQKFTIDLSPTRSSQVPNNLRKELATSGYNEVHTTGNINYRLCDYNPDTAAPGSDNGCGVHTDYGTFSIIFQDGTPWLEIEDAKQPGRWIQVPEDATIILAGWCTVILTGGVRRLSAVLFVAPDLDIELKPLEGFCINRAFSDTIITGGVDVKWFKDVMGKKWRHREGNEEPDNYEAAAQAKIIEKLVWD
ncbi:hypothetical protein THAR02_00918 [Trichoderma harzianum]|uniref:Isopenicillin N synthase-like Fe(2+) 2OG dioxygenase domain-containing protein n=1 Tax=Trichoderma harzianum TaxID=5544 RepID=A0A0G0ARA8_TRIHA|nr:hypothetical protein THAR02_00918 [Trichoderma harzianum]